MPFPNAALARAPDSDLTVALAVFIGVLSPLMLRPALAAFHRMLEAMAESDAFTDLTMID